MKKSKTSRTPNCAMLLAIVIGAFGFASYAQDDTREAPHNPTADGSRLTYKYRYFDEDPSLRSVRIPEVAFGAIPGQVRESLGAAAMPNGFTLSTGKTVPVLQAHEVIPRAGIRPFAPESDRREKFVTLHTIEFKGVPLAKGSDFLSIVSADGRPVVTRQRGVPVNVNATEPEIGPAAAQALAYKHFGAGRPIWPQPRLEIWVNGNAGFLTWAVWLEDLEGDIPRSVIYWVSAVEGLQVIHSENQIYSGHNGTVTGTFWPAGPRAGTTTGPLGNLLVTRTTDGSVETTASDGAYRFALGSGSATLAASLQGPFVSVENAAGAEMMATAAAATAVATDLEFNSGNDLERAQVTAAVWINSARALADTILLPTELARLPAEVNIPGACNAYWTGSKVQFYQATAGCPNTAYADVILHEYGHGVDASKGGIVDSGLSEGFGDAMAILGTRQPCVGRSFLPSGGCLRDASEDIDYPRPSGATVHEKGRPFAGFTWEMVQQLRNRLSTDEAYQTALELTLASAAANPSDIVDAVQLTFVADDDDSDLASCSPNQKELQAAADSRSIPRPADCS